MTRVLAALRWETTLQSRHQFYTVTAVVAVVWVGVLRSLPEATRQYPASVVPFFVLVNLQITAFYFAAALMLLERAQGVSAALLTSPLRPGEYLWVKALALTALGAAENTIIVLFVFGPYLNWGWLLLGTGLLAILYVLLGLAVVARHAALNTFLVPSVGWIAAFSLPLLGVLGLVPRWLFMWHPMMPSLVLLEAASGQVSAMLIVYGIAGAGGWCAIAFLWARSRLLRVVAPGTA